MDDFIFIIYEYAEEIPSLLILLEILIRFVIITVVYWLIKMLIVLHKWNDDQSPEPIEKSSLNLTSSLKSDV